MLVILLSREHFLLFTATKINCSFPTFHCSATAFVDITEFRAFLTAFEQAIMHYTQIKTWKKKEKRKDRKKENGIGSKGLSKGMVVCMDHISI